MFDYHNQQIVFYFSSKPPPHPTKHLILIPISLPFLKTVCRILFQDNYQLKLDEIKNVTIGNLLGDFSFGKNLKPYETKSSWQERWQIWMMQYFAIKPYIKYKVKKPVYFSEQSMENKDLFGWISGWPSLKYQIFQVLLIIFESFNHSIMKFDLLIIKRSNVALCHTKPRINV